MSVRTLIVVFLALLCGFFAAVGVVTMKTKGAPAAVETSPVVAAAVTIQRGHSVAAEDLKIIDWPKALVPEGALTKIDDAVDRAAMSPLLPGEPIMDAKLAPLNAGRGVAALVPPGMRAYAIQSSRISANVAGFVLPGNRVDVLLTIRQSGQGLESSTTTLLQAVEILAVGQQLDAPAENKVSPKEGTTVTLVVTPEQAAILDLGQTVGNLALSLRNPEDQAEAETTPVLLSDIQFREESPLEEIGLIAEVPADEEEGQVVPEESKEPMVYEIVTFRGSNRGQVLVYEPESN